MQMVMMVFRTTLEDQVLPWLEHEHSHTPAWIASAEKAPLGPSPAPLHGAVPTQ